MEYYAPNDLDVNVDDWVVVESKRGIEIGSVKFPPKDVEDGDVTLPLKKLYALLQSKISKSIIKMIKMPLMHYNYVKT